MLPASLHEAGVRLLVASLLSRVGTHSLKISEYQVGSKLRDWLDGECVLAELRARCGAEVETALLFSHVLAYERATVASQYFKFPPR